VAASGSSPVRRNRQAARPKARPADRDQQPDDARNPTAGVVALPGLALAPAAGQQERLGAGLRALSARPKLRVGGVGDRAEIEADAMADAVVSRLRAGPVNTGGPATDSLRRAPASPGGAEAAIGLAGGELDGSTEQALRAASPTGTALAPALRREYEDAFGADFSAVRVHSGPASARLNSALGARAFTLGSDIYFGDRVPGTASADDRHLMAHELAHTLQDGGTAHRQVLRRLAVQITPSRGVVEDEDAEKDSVDEEMKEGAGPAEAPPLTVAPREELFIDSVAIVGRPSPLFTGSMGDHLTAFVITRKGVENAIVDQTYPDAVRELKEIVAELVKLPGWDLVDALKPDGDEAVETTSGPDVTMESKDGSPLPGSASVVLTTGGPDTTTPVLDTAEPTLGEVAEAPAVPYRRSSHHTRFVEAQENLQACQLLLDSADTDDLKIVRLQDYIAAYLELRELVPLSVSNWNGANRGRGGKGDGETGLPGLLADPDTQPPGQLRRDFLSTIATYRMAQAAVEPNAQALAVLMPGLDHALSADERTTLMARQHVQSVLTNFPQNFAGLAEDILLAEGRARERTEAKKAKEKRKSPAKKRALPVVEIADSDDEFEAEEPPGRTQEENFAIIENHLVRLVRMRYAEAAATELAHQQRTIRLHADDEQGATAVKDAQALTNFLTTKPATDASGEEEKDEGTSHGSKRSRGSEKAAVDDVYGSLSPEEAKLVYTGRDIYKGKRKADAHGATELAVQIVLDDAGAVAYATVERQGKYTKGAHTLPWMQWLIWLNADIEGKQPAAALETFTAVTVPKIRTWLSVGSPPLEVGPLSTPPSDTTMVEELVVASLGVAEVKEAEESKETEPELLPSGSMPLVELQAAIAEMLDEITDAPDSSVLDATDTGGKGEAPYRVKLAAYQRGELTAKPEELVSWILALCDVGEAETDLAERTVNKALLTAKQDYSAAYRDSGISDYELSDLADRASIGKAGVFEPSSDSSSDSEPDSHSDSEDEKRLTKKRRKSLSGRSGSGGSGKRR